MIRFIDLRGQINDATVDDDHPLGLDQQEPMFAFYDTVGDTFVYFNQTCVWRTRDEFLDDVHEAGNLGESRYLRLMPDWVG